VIFTSFEFIVFFVLVVLILSCLRNSSAKKWLLLAASICFYLSWSVPCILLILFTSIFDYFVGRKMGRTIDPRARKRLLIMSLLVNLGLLGFFKYSNFFVENFCSALNLLGWHITPPHFHIILPPAISFFTFASMSYVLDLYYERIPVCESARDYTLFVTFFPKLLSGPIVRARELLPQFQGHLGATAEDVEIGLNYFLIGAVKKLVIADQIAGHVNLIFASPGQYDGFTLLMGVLGYTTQIYCDFSGYSDMAIGCARILGFRFPENFQMPFSASTIADYWRRWHITMSQWFRDYLFLPLEIATRRNPSPALRVSLNVTITMLLCGLWHGASWNFVIWGGIHGTALATHKAWTMWNPLAPIKQWRLVQASWNLLSHVLTLSVILLAMIFFRASSFSDATSYLSRLLSWTHSGTRLGSPYILGGVLVVFLTHLLVGKDRNLAVELSQWSLAPRILAYSSLLVALVLLGGTAGISFIYFQF
jgi:alginate O-acetyltransferase complex protein AlgI